MALELMPYQVEGAQFLASRPRAGLLDLPGLGKSAQVVRATDLLGVRRGWISGPAVARRHWCGEFAKFGLQKVKAVKGHDIHDFVAWAHGHFDIMVTSHEMTTKWAKYLHERCEVLDFMTIDEGHFLKNSETQRAQRILGPTSDGTWGAMQWAHHGWWLTGTPVPNDPIDIYTFLRFVRAMPLEKKAFAKRYFNARHRTYGTSHTALEEMLPELRTMIADNSICRTLGDIGQQLPPIFITDYLVDGNTHEVRDLLLKHPGLDKHIIDALNTDKGIAGLEAGHIATLRRLIGEAKALPYAATLLGELESGLDKMVVFAHHQTVLTLVRDYLIRHGIRCGVINGQTNSKSDEAVEAAFQNEPSFRVILLNTRKGGTALTLTASCNVDQLEADWAPASNYQALKRVHRLTQTRSVRARIITLADSFDVEVNKIIAAKTKAVGELDIAASRDMPLATLEEMLGR